MVYINVDPITRKVKEYANSGEWMAAVEKATSGPKPKPIKKMTYAEASKKLREEVGIDLRSPDEKQQEKIDAVIEQKVAEGISAALARQQTTQSPAASTQSHSPQAKQETHSGPFAEANAAMARIHEMQKELGLKPSKACGCTHAKASKMTYPAAEKKLREEFGIDLRSLHERQDATTRALIEKKNAEKKAAALAERRDIVQSPEAKQAVHSKEVKTYSGYSTGPVMGCQKVTWGEAQKRLKAAGVEI